MLDRLRVVLEGLLLVVGPEIDRAEVLVALREVRIVLDALLVRLLGLLVRHRLLLGLLLEGIAALGPVVRELGRELGGPRERRGDLVPLFFLSVGHRELEEDAMVRRIERVAWSYLLMAPSTLTLTS